MKIANNVTELVGNTPLVKLNRVTEGAGATVVARPVPRASATSVAVAASIGSTGVPWRWMSFTIVAGW